MELSETTQTYMEALNNKLSGMNYTITAVAGRKFDRLMTTAPGEVRPSSVHAFIERDTSLLYKPASLKTPAKIARYDLSTLDGIFDTVKVADPFGSYLYLSR
ncbi:MAG: hypothetical protein H9W81_07665 [Enterococcus sp.]|nr:hypothetical protein [Enterococcus sp.]